MTTTLPEDIIPDNDQTRARAAHLEEIKNLVGNAYPNKFTRTNLAGNVEGEDTISALADDETIKRIVGDEAFSEAFTLLASKVKEGARPTAEELEPINTKLAGFKVQVSGRLATPPRVMGKAAFVHLSDGKERLQIYVRKQEAHAVSNDSGREVEEDESGWKLFGLLDHGDFIGVEGKLFVTKTGELSVHVRTIQFLSKALVPMPDKMHGINDPEIRQRRRYADLIASSLKVGAGEEQTEGEAARPELSTREVFERRSKLITAMRRYLDDHGYIEVETPMLSPIASGAAARPFETFHKALGIPLYLRIAPELYLKRLLVGGFERVYELNRNFRNEGISTRHNPEFTMLEFYTAYKDVNWMMDFCEEMVREAIKMVNGTLQIEFEGMTLDFSNFKRLTMKEAIRYFWKLNELTSLINLDIDEGKLNDLKYVRMLVKAIHSAEHRDMQYQTSKGTMNLGLLPKLTREDFFVSVARDAEETVNDPRYRPIKPEEADIDRGIQYLFEYVAESNLTQPTFITDFPKAISPLSKASPDDPAIAERFELYVAGMEVANGFSELNDPKEQYDRFNEQMKQREHGDDEAMQMDEDYVRALSYGMPPAAGIGIGIDRLTMLLTNRRSIRDVILFPHMRPARQASDEQASESEEKETASES
ncbi:MAG TPA: lysine--tRNA ligase [Pyrinomonadaceae bacterium]|nr:lysine--tRNA ligase [Pyrinomonadaceae bacterium]